MEALGASERVIAYLEAPAAPQIAGGKPLTDFSGMVRFVEDVAFPRRGPLILCCAGPSALEHKL